MSVIATVFEIQGNSDQTEGRGDTVARARFATAQALLERWGDGKAVHRDWGVMGVSSVSAVRVDLAVDPEGLVKREPALLYGHLVNDGGRVGWSEEGVALRERTVTRAEHERAVALAEKFGAGPVPAYVAESPSFDHVTFTRAYKVNTPFTQPSRIFAATTATHYPEAAGRAAFVPADDRGLTRIDWIVEPDGSVTEVETALYGRFEPGSRFSYEATDRRGNRFVPGPVDGKPFDVSAPTEPAPSPERVEYDTHMSKITAGAAR